MANCKRAVVLGASEEGGTGWTIAQALAAQNMHVHVGARRVAGIKKLAAEISGTAQVCDATEEDQIADFMAQAAREGPIDCAVLAAGAGVGGLIDDIAPDVLQACMRLNFEAPLYFIRHAARHMQDGGAIILISSIAANNPWPGYVAYGCAKAAVQTLVRYAALEYGARGIRVNAVCPGPISTPASAHIRNNPRANAIISREVPLGRVVTPQEVAETVAWLGTSPGWITGEIIHTDGGMFLRRPPNTAELKEALSER